jgi:hypothetical protein
MAQRSCNSFVTHSHIIADRSHSHVCWKRDEIASRSIRGTFLKTKSIAIKRLHRIHRHPKRSLKASCISIPKQAAFRFNKDIKTVSDIALLSDSGNDQNKLCPVLEEATNARQTGASKSPRAQI